MVMNERSLEIKAILRDKIKIELEKKGLSYSYLAEMSGSNRKSVRNQLNSDQTSIEKLIEYLNILNLDLKIKISKLEKD